MRTLSLVFGVLLLLCVSGGTTAAKEKRIKPGEIAERATKSGTQYAVHVPKKWRKKQKLPLVIWIPIPRRLPAELTTAHIEQDLLQRFGGWKGGAFYCVVLLQAHNKENPRDKSSVDVKRYLELLERDVHAVDGVIDDVRKALPVLPGGVVIRGTGYAAEVAMGIAARRPERFSAALLTDLQFVHRVTAEGGWFVLPESLSGARDLPVLLSYHPEPTQLERRAKIHVDLKSALDGLGLRRVELFAHDPKSSYPVNLIEDAWFRLAEIIDASVARAEHTEKLEEIAVRSQTAAALGELSRALGLWRKMREYEAKHGFEHARSDGLYKLLESHGRKRLAEIKALPGRKQKQELKKLAKLFKGTPFGDELAKDR